MGDIIIGRDVILQEFEALHDLLVSLPTKAQLGPKSFVGQVKSLKEHGVKHLLSSLKEKARENLRDLSIDYTCFEFSHHVVVLGTSLGITFFYDRNGRKLTRLPTEAGHDPVTCLKLLPLQSCLACGHFNGCMLIFSYMLSSQGLTTKPECLQVLGAHHSAITCVEWSPDGTLLYSGDTNGRIVMTVVKLAAGMTQSVLLFVENAPVVQLSYSSKALLVSTWKRTILWNFTSEQPVQVGQKERKSPGKFGACFYPPARQSAEATDPALTIYTARPGLRLWTAHLDGKVSATLMYKGLMNENPPGIRTLSPLPSPSLAVATKNASASGSSQFGHLEIFHGQFIVTWDLHRLWVLDTSPCAVVCCHSSFHGDIVDVCTVGHEVFVLQQRGPRLIRKFSLIPKLSNPLVKVSELLEKSLKDEGKDEGEDAVADEDTSKIQTTVPRESSLPLSKTQQRDMSGNSFPTIATTLPEENPTKQNSTAGYSAMIKGDIIPTADEFDDQSLVQLASKIQNVADDDYGEIVFRKKRNKKKNRREESPKTHLDNIANYIDEGVETTTEEMSDISSELDFGDRSASNSGDQLSDGGDVCNAHVQFIHVTKDDRLGELEYVVPDVRTLDRDLLGGTSDLQWQLSSSSSETLEKTLSQESTTVNTPTEKLSREEEYSISCDDNSRDHSLGDSYKLEDVCHTFPQVYSNTPVNISDMSFSERSLEASQLRSKWRHFSPAESSMSVVDSVCVEFHERQTDSDGTPPVCLDSEGAEELEDTSSWASSSRTLSELEYSSLEFHKSLEMSNTSQSSTPSKSSQQSVGHSLHLLVDSWSDCSGPSPGHAVSLAVSDTHLWCVNNYENIFYCPTHFEVLSWTRLDGEAKMIAVNTCGDLIWCIDRKNYAYARKGVRDGNLIGKEWIPVEKEMRFVAVEESAVWGIKLNGDVFARTEVSKENPEGKNWRTVRISTEFVHASCLDGLVWFLDRKNVIHVYKSADNQADVKENWATLDNVTARWMCLAVEGVSWIIDTKGSLWFSGNVTRDNPTGGDWYQVSLGQYLMHDPSLLDTIWSWVRRGDEAKLLTASPKAGLWILGKNGSVNASHGHLLGSYWFPITPLGMARSVFWSYITARAYNASTSKGHVWALQPNGELVCFEPGSRPIAVESPERSAVLKLVAASSKTVWGITHNFKVVQLGGASQLCPQGLGWVKLPLEKFNIGRVCHLSSGSLCTWAVEETGSIWLRIGGQEDSDPKISQVWLPVEGESLSSCRFVKVAVSPDDVVVWAIDDRFNVYARRNVTPDFPLGTSWEIVPGIGVKDLCVSASHLVWAICTNGDIACRFGVSETNTLGDYWKKVPGNFELISITPDGELWAIDQNGQMFCRKTQHFYGTQSPFKPRTYSALFPGEEEWELI